MLYVALSILKRIVQVLILQQRHIFFCSPLNMMKHHLQIFNNRFLKYTGVNFEFCNRSIILFVTSIHQFTIKKTYNINGHFRSISGHFFANYRIVASTSPSRIEAHAGLFRSLMKGIFDPYVL